MNSIYAAFLVAFLAPPFLGFGVVFFLGLAFFLSAAFFFAGDFLGDTGLAGEPALASAPAPLAACLGGDAAFFLGDDFFAAADLGDFALFLAPVLVAFFTAFFGDFLGLAGAADGPLAATADPFWLDSSAVTSVFFGDEERDL
jgi:hypothetical protein